MTWRMPKRSLRCPLRPPPSTDGAHSRLAATMLILALALLSGTAKTGWSQSSGSVNADRQPAEQQTDQPPSGSSDAVRDALRQTSTYPWYDPEADRVRRVDVTSSSESASVNRDSDWQQAPPQIPTRGWSRFGDVIATVMKVIFWVFIFSVLAALIWILVRVFLNVEARQKKDAATIRIQQSSSDVDRVEHLPFQVQPPRSDLLSEARRHYEAGNYRDAMIYLFSYMLLHLDKKQLIHLAKGKTNRQYLWEVRPKERLFELLENAMIAFEDVFFGDHNLQLSEFEECWRGLDEFHHLVDEGTGQ